MCVHYVAGFCRLLKLKVLICKYFLFGLGHGLDRRTRSVQRKLQKWELYLKNLNTAYTLSVSLTRRVKLLIGEISLSYLSLSIRFLVLIASAPFWLQANYD